MGLHICFLLAKPLAFLLSPPFMHNTVAVASLVAEPLFDWVWIEK